jgi:hypothetical protein
MKYTVNIMLKDNIGKLNLNFEDADTMDEFLTLYFDARGEVLEVEILTEKD